MASTGTVRSVHELQDYQALSDGRSINSMQILAKFYRGETIGWKKSRSDEVVQARLTWALQDVQLVGRFVCVMRLNLTRQHRAGCARLRQFCNHGRGNPRRKSLLLHLDSTASSSVLLAWL
jgi:hypothetical protein